MVLPNPFTTAASYILTFDFDNFDTKVQYKKFYLFRANSSGGTVDQLVPTTDFYSYVVETSQAPGTGTTTFDSAEFIHPKTVKGTAVCNIGTIASVAGGDDTVKAQLWKWDGSTATAITSQFTKVVTDAAATVSFSMPCTTTHIAEGEQLRLIVVVTVAGGGEWIKWGHDPAGRTGTTGLSSSRIIIPFKFDG